MQAVHDGEPVVCFVRDPRDVIVTWWVKYGWEKGQRQALEDFIPTWEHEHFVRHGLLFFHVPTADHVLRYEDGLSAGLASLGVDVEVPVRNQTRGKDHPASHYHTEASLRALDARFGAEMRALGY